MSNERKEELFCALNTILDAVTALNLRDLEAEAAATVADDQGETSTQGASAPSKGKDKVADPEWEDIPYNPIPITPLSSRPRFSQVVGSSPFWLLVWPQLSTIVFSAENKKEHSMEAASRNDPCVQKVLQVVMQYAGAFAAFVLSRTADLGGKVGRIFSHRSLEELNGEPSNKTPAWIGNMLFGWEVTKILHGTGLNSTGKLTNR
jgi:hypothetical protein